MFIVLQCSFVKDKQSYCHDEERKKIICSSSNVNDRILIELNDQIEGRTIKINHRVWNLCLTLMASVRWTCPWHRAILWKEFNWESIVFLWLIALERRCPLKSDTTRNRTLKMNQRLVPVNFPRITRRDSWQTQMTIIQ